MNNMVKKTILIILMLSLGLSLFAQVTAASFPADKVDAYLQDFFESVPYPGISLVFATAEGEVWSKGYGVERLGQAAPMTADSSNAIGSLTKSFTALAIMRLWEQGKVELDSPVTRYLPWFRTADKEQSDKITVRMLMMNASGIHSADDASLFTGEKNAMEQEVRNLASVRTVREPGQSFEYANVNWTILGLIIEEVSGMDYVNYMDQEILQALGMDRSTTDMNRFDQVDALEGHYMGAFQAIPAEHILWDNLLPAGSLLHCSASDLGKYIALYLSEGLDSEGRAFVSPESIEQMCTGYLPMPGLSYDMGGDDSDIYYGYGWFIEEVDGRTLVHHGGNAITQSSLLMMDREQGLGVALLMNADYSSNGFNHETRERLLNNLLHMVLNEPLTDYGIPRIEDPLRWEDIQEIPEEMMQHFPGFYRNNQGATIDIRLEGEHIIARWINGPFLYEVKLLYTGENHFICENPEIARPGFFARSNDGTITMLHVMGTSFYRVADPGTRIYGAEGISFVSPSEELEWRWDDNAIRTSTKDMEITIGHDHSSAELQNYIDQDWLQDPVLGRLWMEAVEDFERDSRYTAVLPGEFRITLTASRNKLSNLVSDYFPTLLESIQREKE